MIISNYMGKSFIDTIYTVGLNHVKTISRPDTGKTTSNIIRKHALQQINKIDVPFRKKPVGANILTTIVKAATPAITRMVETPKNTNQKAAPLNIYKRNQALLQKIISSTNSTIKTAVKNNIPVVDNNKIVIEEEQIKSDRLKIIAAGVGIITGLGLLL